MSLTVTRDIPLEQPKPNRNAPCWCGSGKKYKKCHLAEDEAKENKVVQKSGYIAELTGWLLEQKFYQNLLVAKVKELYGSNPRIDEQQMHAVEEAVIFEARYRGKTPLEHFLADAPISTERRDTYKHWPQETMFSIFEVLAVEIGQSAEIHDLRGKGTYKVIERMGTYGMEVGHIVTTRILPVGDDWMFGGGLMQVWPADARQEVEKMIAKLKGKDFTETDVLEGEAGLGRKEAVQDSSADKIRTMLANKLEDLEIDLTVEDIDASFDSDNDGFNGIMKKLGTAKMNRADLEEIMNLITRLGRDEAESNKVAPGEKERFLEALYAFANLIPKLGEHPEPFRWYGNIGICLMELGEAELAKHFWEKSLRIKPGYELADKNLATFKKHPEFVESAIMRGADIRLMEIVKAWKPEWPGIEQSELERDARTFLTYARTFTVNVTAKRGDISFKHCLAINERFVTPDPVNDHVTNEWQLLKTVFLHAMLEISGYLKDDGKRLELSDKGRTWLDQAKDSARKKPISGHLFQTWFTKVDWGELESGYGAFGAMRGDLYAAAQQCAGEVTFWLAKRGNKPFEAEDILEKKSGDDQKKADIHHSLLVLALENHFLRVLLWMGLVEQNEARGLKNAFSKKNGSGTYHLTEEGVNLFTELGRRNEALIPPSLQNVL